MRVVFENKKILILASGSIALYKMLDCISQLTKLGAQVRVAMSKESEKLITPLSFEAMSHNAVLCEDTQSWQEGGANHISYAKWADVLLLAPATANTIAKAAHGIADSVLLSTLLASRAPKILAPAMNTAMLHAPQTRANLAALESMGYALIPPRTSLLACGDEGEGALASIEEMLYHLARVLSHRAFWAGRQVVITGGGSREKIDDVRYLSNRSSGKQAAALARALYMLGAEVCLISSVPPLGVPLGVKYVRVESVREYERALRKELESHAKSPQKRSVLFMAAALADYAPASPQSGKLKKEQQGAQLTLHCEQNPDVLSSISRDYGVYKVGFKAELDSQNAAHHARAMLDKKGCDMVCLNIISPSNPFGGESNEVELFTLEGAGDSKHPAVLQGAESAPDITTPKDSNPPQDQSHGAARISGSKFEVALRLAHTIEEILSGEILNKEER